MNSQIIKNLLSSHTKKHDWTVMSGANGKPYAVDSEGEPGPHFSLSHTKNKIISVYAISKVPIGVDIEQWVERDYNALADYAFGPNEKQEVYSQGLPAFYRIWTIREAMSKVYGSGLADVMDGIDRADGLNEGMQKNGDFTVFYAEISPCYSLAVACAAEIRLDEIDLHVYASPEDLSAPENFPWAIHEGL